MRQFYSNDFKVFAGTLATAPSSQAFVLVEGNLVEVEITIPAGHAGLTGIRLLSQGTQVVPWNPGHFLNGDDQTFNIPLDLPVADTGLRIEMFNQGKYDHNFHLRVAIDTPDGRGLISVAAVPALQLAPVFADTLV